MPSKHNRLFVLLFAASFGLFANPANAQVLSIGVKGGISIPNLTSGKSYDPINSGYKSGLGPDIAIFADYPINGLLSIEGSLEYCSQGGVKNGKQALPVPGWAAGYFPPGQVPPYLYANFDASAKINYLMVPVLAKFGFDLDAGGSWRAYADLGPFVGFLLSAKSVTKGSSYVYGDAGETMPITPVPVSFDTTADIKNQLNSTNYGIAGNIGIAYQFGQHQVFLEAGGNFGFRVIQKNSADGQNRTGAAVVRLGYAFTLNRGAGKNGKALKEPNHF